MKKMCIETNHHVVMSNDLIKSKSNLSLNEIKLLRMTIMQIVKNDTEFMTYRINIKELGKALNIPDTNLYRDVDTMTTHLLQEIVYVGDGNPRHRYKKFQWCSECEYNDGVLTIRLHDNLKPYLLELKGYYTQYLLEDILVLKSKYAIRIYELIRQEMKYQKVYADHFAKVELDINTIRIATGTEDKYRQMGHFKEKVIDKAVEEINEKTGYEISYEPLKISRKMVGFKFKIQSKNRRDQA